jgi:phage shock protein PspC (stress-responsive transcriptional regulator)
MRQVIIVSLDNNAYHMEDEGYAALRRYLDDARANLQNDPDVAEILGDVERSIAAKCAATLRPGKNVVTNEEVAKILEEVGPIVADASETRDRRASEPTSGPKRLYRQPNGAVVEGVCMGLAEYFNLDVVIFRILFVALAVIGGGLGGVVYFIMMVSVPSRQPTTPKVPWRERLPLVHPTILWSSALLLVILALGLLPWVARDFAIGTPQFSMEASSGALGVLSLLLFVAGIALAVWGLLIRERHERTRH